MHQLFLQITNEGSKNSGEALENMSLDIEALKRKIELMNVKITNADIYIKEIEDHKKSIFEFWKFTNKDESLLLNQGEIQEENYKNIVNE